MFQVGVRPSTPNERFNCLSLVTKFICLMIRSLDSRTPAIQLSMMATQTQLFACVVEVVSGVAENLKAI